MSRHSSSRSAFVSNAFKVANSGSFVQGSGSSDAIRPSDLGFVISEVFAGFEVHELLVFWAFWVFRVFDVFVGVISSCWCYIIGV